MIGAAEEFYHSLERFGIKPGLQRIRKLLELLGNPQNRLKFIHVAGTNGKGSTSTELASVLSSAGYTTGLYTSPYVINFRERIKIDGEMISESELGELTALVEYAVLRLRESGEEITEFEAVTAAAFLCFAKKHCDIVVLETGLGGRFDATNVIDVPLLSIITSISMDHMGVLGSTLAEIAFEKAGIIKNHGIVITGSNQPPQAMGVIRQAAYDRTNVLHIVSVAGMEVIDESIFGTYINYSGKKLLIPFCGRHQLENAALVLCAVEELRYMGFHISDDAVISGMGGARIPARTEIISASPLIMLDGSHNAGSVSALADILKKHLGGKRLIALMGMMADKDCKGALSLLQPYFSKVIAVTPSNRRSMKAEEFKELAQAAGIPCECESSPENGVCSALKQLQNYDALVVCGSLYLAADVRKILIDLSKEL